MKRAVFVLAAAAVAVIVFLFSFGRSHQAGYGVGASDDASEVTTTLVASQPIEFHRSHALTPTVAEIKTDSDRFVSLERLKRLENDYRKRITKHQAIKSYLISPLKDQPEFERVVDWVIANGYGIEDLATVWVYLNGILEARIPLKWFEEFAQTNRFGDQLGGDFRADPEKLYQDDLRDRRLRLARPLRLLPEEDQLIDSLFAIAPDPPRKIGPAAEYLPQVPLNDGEPILRDEDWMSQGRLDLAQGYQGPHRSTLDWIDGGLGRNLDDQIAQRPPDQRGFGPEGPRRVVLPSDASNRP
jgi:hypothetical protein